MKTKKSPTDLFDLIKSLDKNEKRFFKMFSSLQAGEKNYLKLFDAIGDQEEYDEIKIREIFKGVKFLKQLSVTKEYLYKLILKSLNVYYIEKSVDFKLNQLIQNVEILFDKALYKNSMLVLQKAKSLATKYERYPQLYNILLWERKIIFKGGKPKILQKRMEPFTKESLNVLNKMHNLTDICTIHSKVVAQHWKSGESRRENNGRPNQVILEELKNLESKDIPNRVRLLLYNTFSIYYFSEGNYMLAYKYLKNSIALREKFPHQIQEAPFNYISDLSSLLAVQTRLYKYNNYEEILEKLRNISPALIPKPSEEIKITIFQALHRAEMGFYIETGQFRKGVELVKEIEKGFQHFSGKLDETSEWMLYSDIATVYFGVGEYRKALNWSKKMLDHANSNNKELSEARNSFVRVFNLVIHYELGNKLYLEYAGGAVYRFLNKRKSLYEFEEIFIKFMSKLPDSLAPKDEIERFKELKEKLAPLYNDPFERKAFVVFNYMAWIDSKIKNKSFQEIAAEIGKLLLKNK